MGPGTHFVKRLVLPLHGHELGKALRYPSVILQQAEGISGQGQLCKGLGEGFPCNICHPGPRGQIPPPSHTGLCLF